MSSKLHHVLDEYYATIRVRIINIICQGLLYGIYLCLMPIVVRVMVSNGLQSRSRKWLLAVTTSIFALSTLYWILSVVLTFAFVDTWNRSISACYGSKNATACINRMMAAPGLPILNDILLINYIIADGVVVWRAWVLCSDQSTVVLMTPVVMLGINTVVYLTTVALRATFLALGEGARDLRRHLGHVVKNTQLAHQSLSLLINAFATSLIAFKAWKYRKSLVESGSGVRIPTQAIKILGLLVESGMIYILIGVINLTSHVILLHFRLGVLTDVFLPVGIQLVGLYPILVVLLVEQNRSLDSKFRSLGTINDVYGGRPSQTEPMTLTSGPASGGQIDSVVKSPNIDYRVTFDSTWEPEHAGTLGSEKV